VFSHYGYIAIQYIANVKKNLETPEKMILGAFEFLPLIKQLKRGSRRNRKGRAIRWPCP
jgi:hypothetical protein